MPGGDDSQKDYFGQRPPPTIDPTELTTRAVDALKDEIVTLFTALLDGKDQLYTEKFKRLTIQILERDTLREAAKIDANERIAAALQAAKEAVGKTETNFSEQLRSINTTMGTMAEGLRREISDLKDRVTESEGQKRGSSANTSFSISVIGVMIAAAVLAMMAVEVVLHFIH